MKILLIGYGAMGQALEKVLLDMREHQIVQIQGQTKTLNLDETLDFDVLVDFSHPNNLTQIINYLKKMAKPAVLCTTGYTNEQINLVKEASKEVPIVYSRNMSIGISVVKKIIKDINRALNFAFDVEITEVHHNQKLDAPSGTALMLAEALAEDYPYHIIDRKHINRKREKNELAIHAIRGGNIAGDHLVAFYGEDEYIEIKHSATSKRLFCFGAIRALEFVVHQKADLYTMDDVIRG